MKVAMYYRNNDVRVEEMPVPKIGKGEMLVKVMASGICGSDVMEWYRIKKAPRVLGHEITGEIVELGAELSAISHQPSALRIGDRVFVSHHVPCNACRYCLSGYHTACETLHKTNYDPGGFAEYLRVPEINVKSGVYILPENMSYEEGTFIEPLACILRGQRVANLKAGQSVLVIGSGISGLLHINMAKNAGAERIIATDVNEYRLNAALKFGADSVINAKENMPERVRPLNDGRLADCVIVCTGAMPAIEQALQSVDKGGTILFFAVPEPGINVSVPINDFWRNEIKMVTSYGAAPSDLALAIEFISARRVNVKDMITHRLGMSDAQLGFKLVAEGKESIKVIIEPWR
ncbi:MAG: alcohol dehydrogenase [Nitrospirae bacterium CG_4_10_14_3_um_filter_44_29]|nr:MAG: alcohol dehydrogenase [Nitrospirae bacterium CG02_land_8_20_14_3_00_44_33]PIV65548.1 MAG: alcohol dehydrogenase [Nitrospirae bacterium CG01_land_8_20_14_3_00_44_22]PIX89444.1 MAG: alcohol dehydrogenase [Nitrospirae bacterium CG_4_10_14_3_um_filter_44_29]